jgi:hypothetical protein
MVSGFSLLSPSFTNLASVAQHNRVSQQFLLGRKEFSGNVHSRFVSQFVHKTFVKGPMFPDSNTKKYRGAQITTWRSGQSANERDGRNNTNDRKLAFCRCNEKRINHFRDIT